MGEEITTGSILGVTEACRKVKALAQAHPERNRDAPLPPIKGNRFTDTYNQYVSKLNKYYDVILF